MSPFNTDPSLRGRGIKRLTKDQVAQMLGEYRTDDKVTMRELADRYGVSIPAVSYHHRKAVRAANPPAVDVAPRRVLSEIELAGILEAYTGGIPAKNLAATYGISVTTVYGILRRTFPSADYLRSKGAI